MPFAVKFIVAALILYSTAIWSEKIAKHLSLWMVLVFITAFLCDLTGTTIMWLHATNNTLGIYGFCGYAALIIMFLHLIWALLTLKKRGQPEKLFNRYSIYAWSVWMIAFYTGIPK